MKQIAEMSLRILYEKLRFISQALQVKIKEKESM